MKSVAIPLHPSPVETPALLVKPCLVICGILAALKVMPVLVSLVMFGLAVYAWRGPKAGIQALSIMFLVLNLNPALFYFWGQGASLRWLVLFSVLGRLTTDAVLRDEKWPFNLNI